MHMNNETKGGVSSLIDFETKIAHAVLPDKGWFALNPQIGQMHECVYACVCVCEFGNI